MTFQHPQNLIAEAQALIDRVQRDLESGEDFLRSQGLDPEELRKSMESQLSPQQRQEAQQAFQADLDAAEQEVQQAALHRAFATPAASNRRVRRPHPMI